MLQITLTAYQTHVSECPVCGKSVASAKGLGPHVRAKHPDIHTMTERIRADFGEDPTDVLESLHHGSGLTVEQISDRFGYHRDQISEAMELVGVEQREYDIGVWVRENREEHQQIAKEAAGLGAAGRKRNGMKGVTGQDHPNWRGGKSIYDAVKKQLKPSFDSVKDDHRADECYKCGVSDCKLDVHHIIPIMAGGTNEGWNFMTLCEQCHAKAEWYCRKNAPELDPVLVE